MTTDTTPAAVAALRDIREQWGDLLHAIEAEPVADWPPVYDRAWEKPAADDAPATGRLPLTLREYPAPINTTAFDAACAIERALFELADTIAAAVQQPADTIDVGTWGDPFATIVDPVDASDTDRWNYPSPTSPGSRRHGLHWCAVWLERALSGENPLCRPVGVDAGLLVAETVAAAHRVMTRALGRDGRDTVLPAPCPWCHGELTARTTSGDPMAAVVTCGTGPTCGAPAPYDGEARRTWRGADLCGLYGALSAATRRATA